MGHLTPTQLRAHYGMPTVVIDGVHAEQTGREFQDSIWAPLRVPSSPGHHDLKPEEEDEEERPEEGLFSSPDLPPWHFKFYTR